MSTVFLPLPYSLESGLLHDWKPLAQLAWLASKQLSSPLFPIYPKAGARGPHSHAVLEILILISFLYSKHMLSLTDFKQTLDE